MRDEDRIKNDAERLTTRHTFDAETEKCQILFRDKCSENMRNQKISINGPFDFPCRSVNNSQNDRQHESCP